MPSVDIAIPCYQYGRYLPDCIKSIQGQGVSDLRMLIIDNASTDDSVAVARELAAADRRIEIVARQKNLGAHASFNEGVDWARSDYFMVLCADDMLTPGSLQRAMAVMEHAEDVAFAIGTDIDFSADEPMPEASADLDEEVWRLVPGEKYVAERCNRPEHSIAAGMVLVRTSAQKAAGHYRPELDHTDDLEMLLRLSCLGRVAVTSAPQGFKRFHSANKTLQFISDRTSDLVERVAAFELFFCREGAALSNSKELLQLSRRRIAERAYWCAVKDLLRGRRSAFDLFALAYRLEPKVFVIPPLGYLSRMDRPLTRLEALGAGLDRLVQNIPARAGER